MPYAPGIQNQSGQFLFQGLSNFGSSLGQGIAEGYKELEKAKQDAAGGEIILNLARQQGLIDPATEAQYHNGSLSTKNGIIANLTKAFALDQTAKQNAALEENRRAMAAYRQQQADALNFTPRTINLPSASDQQGFPYALPVNPADQAHRPGIQMIETRKGVFEPAVGRNADMFNPTGTTIPVVNPKTGEEEGFQVQTGRGNAPFYPTKNVPMYDAQGNLIGYRYGSKALRVPLPPDKNLTPSQIKSAFATFDITASDLANSSKQHAIDAAGNPVQPGDMPVSYAIDTDKGTRIVPVDSFNHLKSMITANPEAAKKVGAPADAVAQSLQNAREAIKKNPAIAPAVRQRLQQAGIDPSQL